MEIRQLDLLTQELEDYFGAKINLVESEIKLTKGMTKRVFIRSLDNLKESVDRSRELFENFGLDLNTYDEIYFNIIYDLFSVSFNDTQLTFLQAYIESIISEEELGTATIKVDGEEEIKKPFKTPEDVWNVIKEF